MKTGHFEEAVVRRVPSPALQREDGHGESTRNGGAASNLGFEQPGLATAADRPRVGHPSRDQSVQRFVRHLRSQTLLPFRRMETAPGEQAQVDLGTGGPVITPDGQPLSAGIKTRRRRTHVFRIVLSHSPTSKCYRLRGNAGREPVKKREAKDETCEEPVT